MAVRRDRANQEIVSRHWLAWKEMAARHAQQGMADEELTTYRWMIEELRVSLFAQELGTSLSASPKRLEKQWEKVTVV